MAKDKDSSEKLQREPLLPWGLLLSRSGQVPAAPGEGEPAGSGKRPMTEKEGRGAFLFWMILSVVLCLLTAIFAVSCGRQKAEKTGSGGGLWTAALIVILLIILAVAAFDFRKAWRAQKEQPTAGKTAPARTGPLPPAAERGRAPERKSAK